MALNRWPVIEPAGLLPLRKDLQLLDTAPTIARLLGITPHHEWEGRCVEEIFD